MIHVPIPRWFKKEHITDVPRAESGVLTMEDACQLLASQGYQPRISSLQHLHAVKEKITHTGRLYEDERHLCLVADLASMERNTLLALAETAFQAKGYTNAFILS